MTIWLYQSRNWKFLKNKQGNEIWLRKEIYEEEWNINVKQNFTKFECWKQGHVKSDCSSLQKKNNFKGKNNIRSNKACITWEDNEVSSSLNYENEEQSCISLMDSH